MQNMKLEHLSPRCSNLWNSYLQNVSQGTWFYCWCMVVGAAFVSLADPSHTLPAPPLVEFRPVHFYPRRAYRVVFPTFTPIMDGHTLCSLQRTVLVTQYTFTHYTYSSISTVEWQCSPVVLLARNQCYD